MKGLALTMKQMILSSIIFGRYFSFAFRRGGRSGRLSFRFARANLCKLSRRTLWIRRSTYQNPSSFYYSPAPCKRSSAPGFFRFWLSPIVCLWNYERPNWPELHGLLWFRLTGWRWWWWRRHYGPSQPSEWLQRSQKRKKPQQRENGREDRKHGAKGSRQ